MTFRSRKDTFCCHQWSEQLEKSSPGLTHCTHCWFSWLGVNLQQWTVSNRFMQICQPEPGNKNTKFSMCTSVVELMFSSWWSSAGLALGTPVWFKRCKTHLRQDKTSVTLGWGYPASAHCHRFCDHTKAVAVYGGNGLFNWLPVSCWDISWPQELCQTVNSTFFLKLQRLCRRFPFVPTLPAPPLRNIWSPAIFSTRTADSSPTWREQLCKLNQFPPENTK